ncbi:30S ribosomal protein S20 [Chlamydiota bacterium]
MPQTKSAIKHMKTSAKRHERNKAVLTEIKTYSKNLRDLVEKGEVEKANSYLKEVYAKYDKAAKRNIIKKQNASRNKAKLAKLVSSVSPKSEQKKESENSENKE